MTHTTAHEVVKNYHQAWTSGKIDQGMSYVADDITCRAPGVDLDGKDAYQGSLGGFTPRLTGIREIAEFFTVRDGKVAESVLMFDRLSYGPPAQG